MQMNTKKPALGRGLSALLENANTDITSSRSDDSVSLPAAGAVASILINQIEANPFQPRTYFEKEALVDLTNSIKEHGIIQPITVRKIGYDKYQIISGERRFKASQIAGLKEIPVYVRIANDQTMLEMAIVENIQRKDLNPIEISLSYQRLIDECNLTQEKLSERIGKSRSAVTNFLRLLNLPNEVQAGLRDAKITMGHAKALLSFKTEEVVLAAYKDILENNLSVRGIEEKTKTAKSAISRTLSTSTLSLSEKKVQEDLSFHFSSKIKIAKSNNGKGKIVIPFDDEEHLKRILDLLD
ncbi:ParB/RepB/Spo0J family partition protein [Flavobacteriales bacterium]|nr:ParB/RepB/Spo0J family partition protein [Flavobacteriales bacterium]